MEWKLRAGLVCIPGREGRTLERCNNSSDWRDGVAFPKILGYKIPRFAEFLLWIANYVASMHERESETPY